MKFVTIKRLFAGAMTVATVVIAAELPAVADKKIDFVRDIQPLLAKHCYECHGEKKQKAELRWDMKSVALKGGEHGPAIVPGKSAESLIIQLVAGLKGEDKIMPQKGERLTAGEIGLLRTWIDQGAVWPDGVDVAKATDKRDHWAFKAPVRPALPKVQGPKSKVQSPIDAFILARLEKEGLKPSPEAGRVTLIRRLSLDLLGLPPAPDEVGEFVNDRSPEAYEKVVDGLLASPHYGERWGRHWLDIARYADSNGYSIDAA